MFTLCIQMGHTTSHLPLNLWVEFFPPIHSTLIVPLGNRPFSA